MRAGTSLVIAFVPALVMAIPWVATAVVFDDGLVHVIDSANSFPGETVEVREGPGGAATTVNVVTGGEVATVAGSGTFAGNNSIVNVSGGTVGQPSLRLSFAFDSATVNFEGGTVNNLVASDNAEVNISGGVLSGDIGLMMDGGNPEVNISGGQIAALNSQGRTAASLAISGGEIGNLDIAGATEVDITGGNFAGYLKALGGSVFEILGTDFNYPLGEIAALSGTLTGTLADGTPIDTDFNRHSTAGIILIPEPSTGLLLACGLLALGPGRARKR